MTTSEQIYREYRDQVFSYIRGKVSDLHEAEDLVSAVFLKIHQKLDTFDPARASLSTWVYTIARNTVVDHFRTRREHLSYDEAIGIAEVAGPEALSHLADALTALKERERDLIVLHYYHGYTLKEVAAMMGMSYINAKAIHKKALNGLRAWMDV